MRAAQQAVEKQHIKVPIHTAVYQWAKPLVAGKVVLDAGCGTAYGTAILAEVAEQVVGVDVDAATIEQASHDYPRPNVEYRVMDCEALDFPPESFDVVISNALVEVLYDYEAYFEGAFRVLKPGGLYLCSTRNAELTFKKPGIKREAGAPLGVPEYVGGPGGHRQEFSPAQLRSELEGRYDDVKIFGQRISEKARALMLDDRAAVMEHILLRLNLKRWVPLSWRTYVRSFLTGVNVDEIRPEDFKIEPGEFADCWLVIGYGAKGKG